MDLKSAPKDPSMPPRKGGWLQRLLAWVARGGPPQKHCAQ